MRTCREMGIPTVAVFSEPDRRAPHVYFAQERQELSGRSPREAYLDVDQLIDVARRTGADSVHPGYGFLSENAGFAEACEAAGLVFIGPSGVSMRAMGDKVEARRRMEAAGVAIVPGTAGLKDEAAAHAPAARFRYPVLPQAAAGRRRRGVRVVPAEQEPP